MEAPEPIKVLVVDDSAEYRLLVGLSLSCSEIDITEAADGVTALELCEQTDFDVMLLDVLMPAVDGFTVMRRLRDQVSAPAVIFLSCREGTSDKLRGERLGAFDYIAKPVTGAVLLHRIRAAKAHRDRAHGSRLEWMLDPATGLPSAPAFRTVLESEIAWAKRYGEGCAIVVGTLQPHHQAEQRQGERASCFRLAGDVIRSACRSTDKVGRTGDGDLAIVIPGADATAVERFCDKLRRLVDAALDQVPERDSINMQLAFALCPEDGTDFASLLYAARHERRQEPPFGRSLLTSSPSLTPAQRAVAREGPMNLHVQRAAACTAETAYPFAVVLVHVGQPRPEVDAAPHGHQLMSAADVVGCAIAATKRASDAAIDPTANRFSLLLPRTNARGAQAYLRRLRAAIEKSGNNPAPSSFWIDVGTAIFPTDATSVEDILPRALGSMSRWDFHRLDHTRSSGARSDDA
ncbi:MAG: response regulator [Candidatus Schekmanbacteria bacterium]|nr:response regulator [Candidatus Schekmanbacteria bacterium]